MWGAVLECWSGDCNIDPRLNEILPRGIRFGAGEKAAWCSETGCQGGGAAELQKASGFKLLVATRHTCCRKYCKEVQKGAKGGCAWSARFAGEDRSSGSQKSDLSAGSPYALDRVDTGVRTYWLHRAMAPWPHTRIY